MRSIALLLTARQQPNETPLLRPSIPIGCRLRLLREIFRQSAQVLSIGLTGLLNFIYFFANCDKISSTKIYF